MFIDRAKITVKSGKGGDGCIAFHHEKFVERGGPSGGNGGRGGSVYFKAVSSQSTLINYRHARKVTASDGGKGLAKKMYGRGAEDVILEVPVGTVILDGNTNALLCDLSKEGQIYLACKGGRGGRGNACFASSRNRAPRIAENGMPGEEKFLILELKLLADVGLVGLPSVGKSTLLSVISSAKPLIADYPFTTLTPQLGVTYLDDGSSFVVADLPGLIEGASNGKGLGLTFLRHIERCRVIIHVLDMEHENPLEDFELINNELKSYGFHLIDRTTLVVCNKVEDDESLKKANEVKEALKDKYEVMFISSILHEGIKEMLYKVNDLLKTAKSFPLYEDSHEDVKIIDASKKELDFVIKHPQDHVYVIEGEKIERTYNLINLSTDEGILRLIGILRDLGVDNKLHELGAQDGDLVKLCDFEFEYFE